MNWLRRSISAQLLSLWLVAILVAHLLAVLVLSWWRSDDATIHPLSARAIETRELSAYKAASHAYDARLLLQDISLPDSEFSLADGPELDPRDQPTRQELSLARGIRKRLQLPPETPVLVRLQRIEPGQSVGDRRHWLEKTFSNTYSWVLEIEVPMPDGRWLRSRHWPTLVPAHWNRVLSFSLLVGMLPAALIAWFFGRRIMRPLTALTEASRLVSRGERVLLPPSGPGSVREITQAFNEMQESLIRFVNGRTQMLAAMGHDLRTPLTSLRIRAELIDDDALRRAMIATLDEMSAMVEETLHFARDDARQEPTQDAPIDALIESVAQEQRARGHTVRRTASLDAGLRYRCRPVHLKRALHNIIDNAARYGEVRVASTIDSAAQVLRIAVEDDGPGIPAAQLELVFEPFTRLDSARGMDDGHGVGLGLAIARSAVRAHGGDVTLHNRSSGGLRAVIELPW